METRYQKRMRIKNNKSFQIFVKTLNGKTIVVDSREQTTLLELKKIIGKRNGLASQNIVLRGGIHMLDDFKSLEENKIANNSTLHMTLRLKGGVFSDSESSSDGDGDVRNEEETSAFSGPPSSVGIPGRGGPSPGLPPGDRPNFRRVSQTTSSELPQQPAAAPSPPPTARPPEPRQEAIGKPPEEKAAKEAREAQQAEERAAAARREQEETAAQEAREAELEQVTVDVENQSQGHVEKEKDTRQEKSNTQEEEERAAAAAKLEQERNERMRVRAMEKIGAAQKIAAETRAAKTRAAAAAAAAQEERAKKEREEQEQEEEQALTEKKQKHEMSSRDLEIRTLEFDYYTKYNTGEGEGGGEGEGEGEGEGSYDSPEARGKLTDALEAAKQKEGVKQNFDKFNKIYNSIKASVAKEVR